MMKEMKIERRKGIYDRFVGKDITLGDDQRAFVVGDIHGEYEQLMEKLEEVGFNFDRDKLFSVGDLVDRGPDSWKVLMLTQEPWFEVVLGNHEELMYNGLSGSEYHSMLWRLNGGNWWFSEAGGEYNQDALEQALDIIESIPNYLTINIGAFKVGVIHASSNGKVWPPKKTKLTWDDPTIWSRDSLTGIVPNVGGLERLFVGHNPVEGVTIQNNVYHIDTLYRTGELTVMEI